MCMGLSFVINEPSKGYLHSESLFGLYLETLKKDTEVRALSAVVCAGGYSRQRPP